MSVVAGGFPDLYVLRHGETVWNAEGRMQGRLNAPLTPCGRAQARRQAEILERLDLSGFTALCSPQMRAVETAALALGHLIERIDTDPRLVEIDVGGWQGLTRAQCGLPPIATGEGADDLGHYDRAPGGEGLAHLAVRCRDLLNDLDGPTILVTHGITGRMLRCLALGRPPGALAELPGGQGCVFRVAGGRHETLH